MSDQPPPPQDQPEKLRFVIEFDENTGAINTKVDKRIPRAFLVNALCVNLFIQMHEQLEAVVQAKMKQAAEGLVIAKGPIPPPGRPHFPQ